MNTLKHPNGEKMTIKTNPVKSTAKEIEARLVALRYLVRKSEAWLDAGNYDQDLIKALDLEWCFKIESPFIDISKAYMHGKVGQTAIKLAEERWAYRGNDQKIISMKSDLSALQAALHNLPEIKIAKWAMYTI